MKKATSTEKCEGTKIGGQATFNIKHLLEIADFQYSRKATVNPKDHIASVIIVMVILYHSTKIKQKGKQSK